MKLNITSSRMVLGSLGIALAASLLSPAAHAAPPKHDFQPRKPLSSAAQHVGRPGFSPPRPQTPKLRHNKPIPLPRPIPSYFRTYTGTVSREFRGGFDLRTGFTTIRIYSSSTPRALNRGDRVQVSGQLNGNTLRASKIRLLSNG